MSSGDADISSVSINFHSFFFKMPGECINYLMIYLKVF